MSALDLPRGDDVLDERDARALTRKMTVLEDVGRAKGAPGLYVVVSDSGRAYLVNAKSEACECDDAFYNLPDGGCMHYRRVKYAIGDYRIPTGVDRNRVDPQLGEHTHGEPNFQADDTEVADA